MRTALLATLAILCAAWTSQLFVTSTSNQRRTMRNGTAGSALELSAADGSTACLAALTDFDESTDATADLPCRNTGAIIVDTYNWATVSVDYVADSGSAVIMQCDTSNDSGTSWGPVMSEEDGVQTIRTWTTTVGVSGRAIRATFAINDELLRCRAWVTGGAAADTLAFSVVLSK